MKTAIIKILIEWKLKYINGNSPNLWRRYSPQLVQGAVYYERSYNKLQHEGGYVHFQSYFCELTNNIQYCPYLVPEVSGLPLYYHRIWPFEEERVVAGMIEINKTNSNCYGLNNKRINYLCITFWNIGQHEQASRLIT